LEKLVLTKRTNNDHNDCLSNSIAKMPTLVSLQLSGLTHFVHSMSQFNRIRTRYK
jgi:hypothetical protein